jgi:hypothetical protein
LPADNEFTGILQWPGYRVYRHEIDEKAKTLDLWVRRKRGNRKLECSGCGRKFADAYDSDERAVRYLPWSEFRTGPRASEAVKASPQGASGVTGRQEPDWPPMNTDEHGLKRTG